MAFRSSRYRRNRRHNEAGLPDWFNLRNGLAAVGTAAIVVLITAMAVWSAGDTEPQRDAQGCRTDDSYPRSHTLIVIDQTDLFPETVMVRIRQVILTEANALTAEDRITVLRLNGDDPRSPIPVLSMCRPEHPDEIDQRRRTRSIVEARYEALFDVPLRQAVGDLTGDIEFARTPLAETLYEISQRSDFAAEQPNRRLIVVSDLLENTPAFSLLRDPTQDFNDFQAARPNFRLPDLSDTEVIVHDVFSTSGDEARQTPQVGSFWNAFFAASGAESVSRRNF